MGTQAGADGLQGEPTAFSHKGLGVVPSILRYPSSYPLGMRGYQSRKIPATGSLQWTPVDFRTPVQV